MFFERQLDVMEKPLYWELEGWLLTLVLALTGKMVLAKVTYFLLAFFTQEMRGDWQKCNSSILRSSSG